MQTRAVRRVTKVRGRWQSKVTRRVFILSMTALRDVSAATDADMFPPRYATTTAPGSIAATCRPYARTCQISGQLASRITLWQMRQRNSDGVGMDAYELSRALLYSVG